MSKYNPHYLPYGFGAEVEVTGKVVSREPDSDLELFDRCAETIIKMNQIVIEADDPASQGVADQLAAVYNHFIQQQGESCSES